ncbi:Transcriptional regulatory protein moc3 [Colletotrichum gloeosporioides]|uniref:Transcriptional regulatory protein moc3 n=1 Tax=Colletotrichum gloeosporioides TaxID=474922 RepID=A0A8H4FCW6_COLGL|nr:Transcriptional regulatory protein moc3 [Colletotrichum gloeosporioides]KAF3797405.1 Transcriptional regulatory protein moc3 [Colletotrichum gloeosporioides]
MAFSVANRPKLSRASAPKSRTGCRECRRRHVKCDQARPFCMKCVKSGRECPGYLDSTSRTLLPSKQARIVPRSHNFSTADTRLFKIPGYETMLFGQQKDWEAFQSFAFSVESGDTLLIDDASIMTPKFAQSAAESSGVRQICCAVGALGRSFQSMTLEDYISEEYQAALEHYGRGVRAIYRLKSSKTTLPSAILASMLFTTFEFMAGSTVNAAKHHNHAVAMMYQYVDLLIEEQGLPLEELRLSDMDKAMFDSLERHDTSPWIESLSKAGHVKILCPARRFPHGCRHRLSMSKIPDRFNSTQQAFTWWNFVQHMMAHSLHPLKVSGDGVRRVSEATKAAAYDECDAFLHSWRTAFTPLLQHAKEHRITHGSRWSRAMILETMYLETISELHARHKTHANMLPAVKPLYLDLIRSMMQLAREKPLNGPATIGLENSIIRPIGFALVRCQDPEVVQEATAALEAIVGGVNMSWTLVYLLKSRNKTKPMVTLERSWGWYFTATGCSSGAHVFDGIP